MQFPINDIIEISVATSANGLTAIVDFLFKSNTV